MTGDKKIGILTFHRAINYGAILQVFALQEKIKSFGVDCEVVDYRNKRLEKKHCKRLLRESKNLKDIAKYFLIYKKYNKKFDKFRVFSDRYIHLGKKCSNHNDLKINSYEYDALICGSDQVWNYNLTDFDKAYFLEFVEPEKRNSYAASFGISTIPEEKKAVYKSLLLNYNYMTIREQQGADIVESLINTKPSVVLDPTLLIKKEEWFKIANERIIKEKYILIYGFGGSKYLMPLAKKLSERKGLKIVVIGSSHKKEKNITYIDTAGPTEWLSLFQYSEYVFTNSFHGTVFSINFNKQFFMELLPEETGVNSRLEDILDLFQLNYRKVINRNENILETSIDYTEVNYLLNKERELSEQSLKKILD